jgi:hypothetical protein
MEAMMDRGAAILESGLMESEVLNGMALAKARHQRGHLWPGPTYALLGATLRRPGV